MKLFGIVSTVALSRASSDSLSKDRFEEASALCQMLRWEEATLILNEEIERLGQNIESEDAIEYLDKFVMLGVVAAESSSSSSKHAEALLERFCPIIEEIHGFADSKSGHCYQSLLAMYGRSSKPREFYILLEFVRTKHEIESSCAQHPHISTCSSNSYKFEGDRKNALIYVSQRMNSVITNYFRISGRERKEMVRDARKLPNRFQNKYNFHERTSVDGKITYPSRLMLRHEHEDAVDFVDFVLKRLSEVRKMISMGKKWNEIKSYLFGERYELSAKLNEFRNTAMTEMFFVNRHASDMNEKYSEMRQLQSRLQSLMKLQATVEMIMKDGTVEIVSTHSSLPDEDQEEQNEEIHEFRPLKDSASQESKVAVSVLLVTTGTIVLLLTQGGRDWIANTSERLRNEFSSSKRNRHRRRGKKSRSRRHSRESKSGGSDSDRLLSESSILGDNSNDDDTEEEEEEEEELKKEVLIATTEQKYRFNLNDISTKGAGSPSPSPPQRCFRTVQIEEKKQKKQKKKASSCKQRSRDTSIKPLVLPSHHDGKDKTLSLRSEIPKKIASEEQKSSSVKTIELTFTAISEYPSLENEEKIKKKSMEPKSFADAVLKNQKSKKIRPSRSLLLAISASKFSNTFTSQYHHILCMKRSNEGSEWKISVKIPESLRCVRYRYGFSSEEEEDLTLDENFVNVKWEVVPDRYLDMQSKYNDTLLSAGSLEFQNNYTAISRKSISRKINTDKMWKRRTSSSKRLRASSTEWYPVYYASTPSPTTTTLEFFGE